MNRIKSNTARAFVIFLSGAVLWTMCLASSASAQGIRRSTGLIDAGTTITVRTNEPIKANDSDGRVYSGTVEQDVVDRAGNIVIPRTSPVEMVVRRVNDNDVAVDLDSITVNGNRYGIETEENVVSSDRKEGIGVNKRTGKYVGGGAVLGAIIGAIAGGGKGAAIGAGVGAGGGALGQVLTRGKSVDVPAESLLTFRLAEPLRANMYDSGYSRNGVHYHQVYDNNANVGSPAYQAGLQAGRADFDRGRQRNLYTRGWNRSQDRRDYEAGYNRGYDERGYYNNTARQKPYYNNGYRDFSVNIGNDNNVTWYGPDTASVFVQVDNEAPKLFASGASGTQLAPWIQSGHRYVFFMRDANGNELARDVLDLRSGRYRR